MICDDIIPGMPLPRDLYIFFYIDIIYTEYSRALESGAEIMCHVQNPMGRPKTWEHVMLTKLQVLLQLDV